MAGRPITPVIYDSRVNWRAGVGGTSQYVGYADAWPGSFNLQSTYGPDPTAFAAWFMTEWENAKVAVPAWRSTTVDGWPEWGSYRRQAGTQVQLLPSGGQAGGTTNVYLVKFAAVDSDYSPPDWAETVLPLPPEQFQINGQTMVSSGETNTSGPNARGAVWGVTAVSAPAGQNVDVTPGFITTPTANWDYFFDVQAIQLYPPAVDANRDGNITFDSQDQTSATNYYRFWVNNDYDGYDNSISDYADLQPTADNNDAKNTSISCTRDLEDYTRLWINTAGITEELQNGTFLLALVWKNVTGNPGLRLFPGVETNGGTLYLTDEATALAQSNAPYGNCLNGGGVDELQGSQPFFISSNYWAAVANGTGTNYFLFDAVSRGSGQLMIAIYKNDGVTKLAEGPPLYLNLQDVKEMYERYTVDNNGAVATTASQITTPYSYDSTIPAESNYILFVHGWNLAPWERDALAETAFKRLYWQGYKGHFGTFEWPTGYGFTGVISAITDAHNYDNSESNAWASATGLLGKLNDLNSAYPGHVYLMAHSMGNVVAGEALRQASSQVVNTYIAMQGAVPAHCYDASTANRITPTPPDCYAHYWTNGAPSYFNGTTGAGSYVNFYNQRDYALGWWNSDHGFKPDIGYGYDDFLNVFTSVTVFLTELNFPTNTYEIFGYADPAPCRALGAQPNVNGAFLSLGEPNQVDLDADPFNFGPDHKGHSAEFNSDNMNRAIFWNTLINKMGL
jgi:Alpha/beta hydrolase of unknown function (DUF900)